ncbi:hypothetical protein ABPG75_002927 [Micractinium tetrahymenae]
MHPQGLEQLAELSLPGAQLSSEAELPPGLTSLAVGVASLLPTQVCAQTQLRQLELHHLPLDMSQASYSRLCDLPQLTSLRLRHAYSLPTCLPHLAAHAGGLSELVLEFQWGIGLSPPAMAAARACVDATLRSHSGLTSLALDGRLTTLALNGLFALPAAAQQLAHLRRLYFQPPPFMTKDEWLRYCKPLPPAGPWSENLEQLAVWEYCLLMRESEDALIFSPLYPAYQLKPILLCGLMQPCKAKESTSLCVERVHR